MSEPLLRLRSVGFHVETPRPTTLLHPLDLDLGARSSLSIIGPSGAGKSTLASIIGVLQPPTQGSYRLNGTEVTTLSRQQRAALRSNVLGFVFQQAHLIDERSAWRNVALGITDPVRRRDEIEHDSRTALEAVGLGSVADRRAAVLSGGERQRVAIARALVKRPALVIADEPTGALDQRTGRLVLDLLHAVVGQRASLVIVTHDERAAEMADRVVEIVDGRLGDPVSVR